MESSSARPFCVKQNVGALLARAGAHVRLRCYALVAAETKGHKIDCHDGRRSRASSPLYQFQFPEVVGEGTVNLEHYRGHVLLLFRFRDRNFTIIGFPCNQFGKQEPGGTGEEILNGIRYVRPGNNYVPNFRLVQKLDVNGETQHPLFTFLKSRCPSPVSTFSAKDSLFYSPQDNADLRWNFEKFLISRDGTPLRRYNPHFLPSDMADDIDALTREGVLPPV
ncbi:hypothetical protein MTO96_007219 [Rhipicephalus appendiculatus]